MPRATSHPVSFTAKPAAVVNLTSTAFYSTHWTSDRCEFAQKRVCMITALSCGMSRRTWDLGAHNVWIYKLAASTIRMALVRKNTQYVIIRKTHRARHIIGKIRRPRRVISRDTRAQELSITCAPLAFLSRRFKFSWPDGCTGPHGSSRVYRVGLRIRSIFMARPAREFTLRPRHGKSSGRHVNLMHFIIGCRSLPCRRTAHGQVFASVTDHCEPAGSNCSPLSRRGN